MPPMNGWDDGYRCWNKERERREREKREREKGQLRTHIRADDHRMVLASTMRRIEYVTIRSMGTWKKQENAFLLIFRDICSLLMNT